MASIYKQSRKRPTPEAAEIITRAGQRLARWIDPKTGCLPELFNEKTDRRCVWRDLLPDELIRLLHAARKLGWMRPRHPSIERPATDPTS